MSRLGRRGWGGFLATAAATNYHPDDDDADRGNDDDHQKQGEGEAGSGKCKTGVVGVGGLHIDVDCLRSGRSVNDEDFVAIGVPSEKRSPPSRRCVSRSINSVRACVRSSISLDYVHEGVGWSIPHLEVIVGVRRRASDGVALKSIVPGYSGSP